MGGMMFDINELFSPRLDDGKAKRKARLKQDDIGRDNKKAKTKKAKAIQNQSRRINRP